MKTLSLNKILILTLVGSSAAMLLTAGTYYALKYKESHSPLILLENGEPDPNQTGTVTGYIKSEPQSAEMNISGEDAVSNP